jgi:hypothetical protein
MPQDKSEERFSGFFGMKDLLRRLLDKASYKPL